MYAYWNTRIEENDVCLDMSINAADAISNSLYGEIFSDADHASDFSRKSTGASASLILGPNSQILLDAALPLQSEPEPAWSVAVRAALPGAQRGSKTYGLDWHDSLSCEGPIA